MQLRVPAYESGVVYYIWAKTIIINLFSTISNTYTVPRKPAKIIHKSPFFNKNKHTVFSRLFLVEGPKSLFQSLQRP